ncbi:arsenic transporter [Thermithiobacillus plumbiphilus]|uniref:Arsenic transporter n=1 Tax=Thermithiobacillus plumbiphilus TaxID=1729899 RepID=A0ABU9D7G1_9PROT
MLTAMLVFLFTLILVIWQPRGLGIGWGALIGAVLALAVGVVSLPDIPVVWQIVWNATFTFVALIIISIILDEAGFFHWAALHIARWGGGHGRRLFPLVILLGAGVSAFFANDGAALILTPIVMEMLLALGFGPGATFAFVMATGFVADSTSLPFVISNLVNIVSADYFNIPFDQYARVMVPVDIAAIVATMAVLGLYFRRDLPAQYALANLAHPASVIRDPLVFRWSFPILGLLLFAYFFSGPLGVPVSLVAGLGALFLLALAGRWWRSGQAGVIPVRKVLREAPWQVVLFSLGMYLVVYGLKNQGLTTELARVLEALGGQGMLAATLGTGFLFAGLSSVMNNMPTVLIGSLAIHDAQGLSEGVRQAMIYANVIGCDLGPKITPIGSLATLLWLHVLDRKGFHIGWGRYMAMGLVLVPPVLLLVLLALVAWLPRVF